MSRRFEPEGLPRQRRGVTPGMVGRYPDFDVLEQAGHWDILTRRVVLDRVHNVPPVRLFDEREAAALTALCDHLTGQVGEDPKLPVLAYVDEKLFEGSLDGFQYFDMPEDRETWRIVARGLDEEAAKQGVPSFALLGDHDQNELCHRFSKGDGFGGPAYPRGYSRFGSPHLRNGETETWEALEAFELDPVEDTRKRGLD